VNRFAVAVWTLKRPELSVYQVGIVDLFGLFGLFGLYQADCQGIYMCVMLYSWFYK